MASRPQRSAIVRFDNRCFDRIPFEEATDWKESLAASSEIHEIYSRTSLRSGVPPGSVSGGYLYEANYLREMGHFLGAVQGDHHFNMSSVAEELQTVRVFHAIMQSSETGGEVVLD